MTTRSIGPLAQQVLQLGGTFLAGLGMAHGETRVPVLAVHALADPRDVDRDLQRWVELRAPGAGHAVNRPDAAVLREMRRRLGVPVLRGDHESAGSSAPIERQR